MIAADGVVTVEVVNDLWVDLVLPLAAIVISVGTLVWSLVARRSDQARLKVKTAVSLVVDGPDGYPGQLLSVEVTNVGRSGSTVLEGITLHHRQSGNSLHFVTPPVGLLPEYPVLLQPGATALLLADPAAVAAVCAREGIAARDLDVHVRYGHGELHAPLSPGARALIQDSRGAS